MVGGGDSSAGSGSVGVTGQLWQFGVAPTEYIQRPPGELDNDPANFDFVGSWLAQQAAPVYSCTADLYIEGNNTEPRDPLLAQEAGSPAEGLPHLTSVDEFPSAWENVNDRNDDYTPYCQAGPAADGSHIFHHDPGRSAFFPDDPVAISKQSLLSTHSDVPYAYSSPESDYGPSEISVPTPPSIFQRLQEDNFPPVLCHAEAENEMSDSRYPWQAMGDALNISSLSTLSASSPDVKPSQMSDVTTRVSEEQHSFDISLPAHCAEIQQRYKDNLSPSSSGLSHGSGPSTYFQSPAKRRRTRRGLGIWPKPCNFRGSCEIMITSTEDSLNHIRDSHLDDIPTLVENGEVRYICQWPHKTRDGYCRAGLLCTLDRQDNNFVRHVRKVHWDAERVSCENCGGSYATGDALARHLTVNKSKCKRNSVSFAFRRAH